MGKWVKQFEGWHQIFLGGPCVALGTCGPKVLSLILIPNHGMKIMSWDGLEARASCGDVLWYQYKLQIHRGHHLRLGRDNDPSCWSSWPGGGSTLYCKRTKNSYWFAASTVFGPRIVYKEARNQHVPQNIGILLSDFESHDGANGSHICTAIVIKNTTTLVVFLHLAVVLHLAMVLVFSRVKQTWKQKQRHWLQRIRRR